VRAALKENRFTAVEKLASRLGVAPLCRALGVPRATLYRRRRAPQAKRARPSSPRALSFKERHEVLELLHSDRFVDVAPAEIVATLVDEGTYLCSTRTMYRLLDSVGQLRERRNQLRHPAYSCPELLATGPNELWSWDITKLLGPAKWTYFYLYVLLDVFSRYVVGWLAARCESAALAARLVEESCRRHGIAAGQLTVHSDRGPSMTSRTMAHLLTDLGVAKTHSRPHVSNDNPFSEAQFKTLKYRPGFPGRFGSLQDARIWCQPFFEWYNHHHRHSGIAYLTPADVHLDRARQILTRRAAVLADAARRHPERFLRGSGSALLKLPGAVWINPPADRGEAEKGGCWDMGRPIISRPAASQGLVLREDAPSPSLLPPDPPLPSLTLSTPKNRALSPGVAH
jgi:putative transposase